MVGRRRCPRPSRRRSGGLTVEGYPALVDEGARVALRVLPDPGARRGAEHRLGVRRLLLLNTTAPWKRVLARLSNAQKLALADNPHGSVPALLEDCLDCAVDAIVAEHVPGEVRTEEAFAEALAAVRTHARHPGARRSSRRSSRCSPWPRGAPHPGRARARPPRHAPPRPAPTCAPSSTASCGRASSRPPGSRRLRDVRRYLLAMQHRARAAPPPTRATPVLQEQVDAVGGRLRRPAGRPCAPPGAAAADVVDIGWMVEELRVSLFAQTPRHGVPGVREAGACAAIAAVTASR